MCRVEAGSGFASPTKPLSKLSEPSPDVDESYLGPNPAVDHDWLIHQAIVASAFAPSTLLRGAQTLQTVAASALPSPAQPDAPHTMAVAGHRGLSAILSSPIPNLPPLEESTRCEILDLVLFIPAFISVVVSIFPKPLIQPSLKAVPLQQIFAHSLECLTAVCHSPSKTCRSPAHNCCHWMALRPL